MTSSTGSAPRREESAQFLLQAKISPPPAPRLVTRGHRGLLDRLVGWEGVTSVVAPAGFGKTALLGGWVSEEQRPVAWVTLGGADADPARFVAYLVEAVAPVLPDEVASFLRGALTGDVGSMTDVVVPSLLNTLEQTGQALLVVLDATEHLTPEAPTWLAVRQLVGYRPDRVGLVLSGREEPPFGLARARAAGRVRDVDEHALALDVDDLRDLLAEFVPDASEHVRDEVARAAEGWPAPAVLAARIASERGLHDPADIADVLAVEGRELLAEEGVARLDDRVADALGTLALLPVFDLEVAACVLPEREALGVIDGLRHGGLLEAVEEGMAWRIWRPMVQALVDRGATRRDSPEVEQGMREAARVLARRGDVASAVRLQARAGADDELVELVAARWGEPFGLGQLGAVEDWLRLVGDERVRADARLLLVRANVAVARRDAEGAEEALRAIAQAEQLEPTDGSGTLAGNAAHIRAHVALRFRGDSPTAVVEARRAAAEPWQSAMHVLEVDLVLAAALAAAGEDREAAEVVRNSLRREGGEGTLTWARVRAYAAIAAANAPEPDVEVVVRHAATGWDTVRELGATEWTNGAAFRLANACARMLEGDLDAAAAEADAADRLLARGLDRATTVVAQLLRIQLAVAAGDVDAARDRLQGAVARLGSWVDPGGHIQRYRRLGLRLGLREQGLPEPLTDRELDVLRALPAAATRADVAAALHVSVDTVKTHLGSAYRKLGVGGRDEAILEARRLGLV